MTTATAALTGDAEEEWTKSLLVKYEKVEEKSVAQGSMPQPAAFAQEINFWKAFFFACFLGALLGLCTLGKPLRLGLIHMAFRYEVAN